MVDVFIKPDFEPPRKSHFQTFWRASFRRRLAWLESFRFPLLVGRATSSRPGDEPQSSCAERPAKKGASPHGDRARHRTRTPHRMCADARQLVRDRTEIDPDAAAKNDYCSCIRSICSCAAASQPQNRGQAYTTGTNLRAAAHISGPETSRTLEPFACGRVHFSMSRTRHQRYTRKKKWRTAKSGESLTVGEDAKTAQTGCASAPLWRESAQRTIRARPTGCASARSSLN